MAFSRCSLIALDCGSESYGVTEWIDFYLNPLSTRHKSYLKDMYHFLQKVLNMEVGKTLSVHQKPLH